MRVEEIFERKKGEKLFLLGNEAAVRGALEALEPSSPQEMKDFWKEFTCSNS